MITIPIKVNDKKFDLLIVLGDENIERIKKYDPVEIIRNLFPQKYKYMQIRNIAVAFATPEEESQITNMFKNGSSFKEIHDLLYRGWIVQEYDLDGPYSSAK